MAYKGDVLQLSNHIDKSCIAFLEAKSRDQAIESLVDLMVRAKKIEPNSSFYQAVLQREKIVSTGIGLGVAIPHAKIKEFDEFVIAIGIQRDKGIEWNSLDAIPVRLIFLIGGPEKKQTEYLQLLSKLTMALKEETIRKALFDKNINVNEVLPLFSPY